MPVGVMITTCVVCFILGIIAMCVILWVSTSRDKKRQKKVRCQVDEKKKIGTMDVILIFLGAALIAFTVCMIKLFCEYGSVPEVLVTCVFGAITGECGFMGWIKTTKDRKQERKWELEDRKDNHKNE